MSVQREENWNLAEQTFGWLRQRREELVEDGSEFNTDIDDVESLLKEELKSRDSLRFALSALRSYYRILQEQESKSREKRESSEEKKVE